MTYLFTGRQNFGMVQIESICRRKNTHDCEIEIFLGKDRKHSGKRRLSAFSPFPTMFSKGLFFMVINSHECVVEVIQSVHDDYNNVQTKELNNGYLYL